MQGKQRWYVPEFSKFSYKSPWELSLFQLYLYHSYHQCILSENKIFHQHFHHTHGQFSVLSFINLRFISSSLPIKVLCPILYSELTVYCDKTTICLFCSCVSLVHFWIAFNKFLSCLHEKITKLPVDFTKWEGHSFRSAWCLKQF